MSKFNANEYSWTDKDVIGTALLIMGGEIDSYGDKINADIFYKVGKRISDGMVAIIPTERNQRHEFVNSQLKRKNQFN